MVYMEKTSFGKTRFWDISINGLQVLTKSGILGSEGVSRIRQFATEQEALQFYVEQVQLQGDNGYTKKENKRELEDVEGESGTECSEERRNSKGQSSLKRQAFQRPKKRGLRGVPPPDTTRPIGVIDPAAQVYGELYENEQGDVFDAMLVKTQATQNTYYILQLIYSEEYNQFYFYARWGRVNTAGQCFILYPKNKDEAIDLFEEKFFEKTGLEWEERNKYQSEDDMYQYITISRNKTKIEKMQRFQNEEFNKIKKELKNTQNNSKKKRKVVQQENAKSTQTVTKENLVVSEENKCAQKDDNQTHLNTDNMDVDNVAEDPYEFLV